MSWSVWYESVEKFESQTATHSSPTTLGDWEMDQLRVGRAAAASIIASQQVGKPESRDFNVNIAGHANPGHEPSVSSGRDYLQITVAQK